MKTYKKLALIIFSVFILLVSLEVFSGIVLKLHSIHLKKKTKSFADETFEPSNSELLVKNSRFSSQDVMKEMSKVSEASEYTSYLIFKFNPVKSKLVNIGKDGYRLNSNSVVWNDNTKKIKIWLIGGTEAFGYLNTDAETISSLLEQKLNNKNSKFQFEVKNHGVFGYASTQQLIKFRLDLIEQKPDMIIVMNGFNDYKISWKYQSIFATDLYTHIYLKKYWEFHKNKLFFDKKLFFQYIKDTFSNTSLLAYLGKKWFYLKYYEMNIADWKEKYKNRSAYEKKINLEGLKKSTNL